MPDGAGTAIITQAALDGVSEISVFVPKVKLLEIRSISLRKSGKKPDVRFYFWISVDPAVLKQELVRADILINATSIGMEPNTDACPIPVTGVSE